MPMAHTIHGTNGISTYMKTVDIDGFHVGRYTMDGWYRMGFSFDSTKVAFPPVPSCEFLSQVSGGRRRHRRQMHHHRHQMRHHRHLILPPPRHPRSRRPAGWWKRYSSCGLMCFKFLNAKMWKLRLIYLYILYLVLNEGDRWYIYI